MKTILVSAVALIDVDERILLAQRPADKSCAGLWEFPGGKIEPGETPEAALARELHEELAINIQEACLAALNFASYHYPDFHLLLLLYICRHWHGNPQACEGQKLAWVPANRLRTYSMPPADLGLIASLEDLLI